MADNLSIRDGSNVARTIAAKDVASVHVPRHIVVDEANGVISLATSTLQATGNTKLDSIITLLNTQSAYLDGLEALIGATNTGNASILAKLIAAPATAALQGGGLPAALGQGTMAQSLRVVLPSDQSPVPAGVYNGGATDRVVKPNAVSRLPSSLATTNATSAKASAGNVFFAFGYNAANSMRYLKVYDKASAPTVGTDVPVLTLALPPQAAFAFDFPSFYCAAGIAYALTTGAADADSTAVAVGDIVGLNVGYA